MDRKIRSSTTHPALHTPHSHCALSDLAHAKMPVQQGNSHYIAAIYARRHAAGKHYVPAGRRGLRIEQRLRRGTETPPCRLPIRDVTAGCRTLRIQLTGMSAFTKSLIALIHAVNPSISAFYYTPGDSPGREPSITLYQKYHKISGADHQFPAIKRVS